MTDFISVIQKILEKNHNNYDRVANFKDKNTTYFILQFIINKTMFHS